MQFIYNEEKNHVSVRLDESEMPLVAVEELKKERAKREKLEKQMAAVLAKLGIEEV